MMRAGCFDLAWMNFGPLYPSSADDVLPAARELGVGIVAREAFAKGRLFSVAKSIDPMIKASVVARMAIRWVLSHRDVSSLAVGVRNPQELLADVDAASAPMDDADRALLARLKSHEAFALESR
jgi:aryl-alcohol dehydrogenase-like predicted oxidoreductase